MPHHCACLSLSLTHARSTHKSFDPPQWRAIGFIPPTLSYWWPCSGRWGCHGRLGSLRRETFSIWGTLPRIAAIRAPMDRTLDSPPSSGGSVNAVAAGSKHPAEQRAPGRHCLSSLSNHHQLVAIVLNVLAPPSLLLQHCLWRDVGNHNPHMCMICIVLIRVCIGHADGSGEPCMSCVCACTKSPLLHEKLDML